MRGKIMNYIYDYISEERKKENLEKTMAAVKEIHPYEEPVINVIPLYAAGI